MTKQQKNLLTAEFILLYIGAPFVMIGQSRSLKLSLLLCFALFALHMLRRAKVPHANVEWNWKGAQQGLGEVFKRFVPCALALTALLFVLSPEKFLAFPRERPAMWALVMVWYPIVSVLPQELIYRSLFYHRYRTLFTSEKMQMAMSALMFGWMHIIFLNWVAVGLCILGGAMFWQSYTKHRSLALVVIEHGLYGCFIFTLGLGWYFYGGAAR